MKVILLAGGFGTRLAEYTDVIPKPMVPIGGKPILWHIMRTYARFGHKDFYVALGYKAEVIKDYFLNYRSLNSDFTVDLASGNVVPHQHDSADWRVTLVHTGDASMTGGRVKRMQSFIGNETCLLTLMRCWHFIAAMGNWLLFRQYAPLRALVSWRWMGHA